MTTTTMDPRAEIERRTSEFEQANQRAHARFLIGALLVSAAVLAGLLLGLASWQP